MSTTRVYWRAINKMNDAPDHDCLVAFTHIDQQIPGDRLDDLSNLGASIGYLSWSRDKTFWSIHEDGEVIVSSQVTALCEIVAPIDVVAGKGARPE